MFKATTTKLSAEPLVVVVDYASALKYYHQAADQNDPEAFYQLGCLYQQGCGDIAPDEKLAESWYQKAIKAKYAPAYVALAKLYFNSADPRRAMITLQLGAASSDREAQYQLAIAYAQGRGGEKDEKKALTYCRQAAEQGHVEAQVKLAREYFQASATPEDLAQSLHWFKQAASQNNVEAARYLGALTLSSDEKLGIAWLEKAASQNDFAALATLGKYYAVGKHGLRKDTERAREYLKKAADMGETTTDVLITAKCEAYFNLALLYKRGESAAYWYVKSAELGFLPALYNLGSLYYNGWDVPQDKVKAAQYFRQAAEKNNPSAQCILGLLYEYGEGVEKNIETSFFWYKKSADQGHVAAEYCVGRAYYFGVGVDQSKDMAIIYLTKAAKKNDPKAQLYLGGIYIDANELERGLPFMTQAAEAGELDAQFWLGRIYLYGRRNIPVDLERARLWLQRAHSQGDLAATVLLAQCALQGVAGSTINPDVGKALLLEPAIALSASTRNDSETEAKLSIPTPVAADHHAEKELTKRVEQLLLALTRLRMRIATLKNKIFIKKCENKIDKLVNELMALDYTAQSTRTLNVRVNQLEKNYADLEKIIAEQLVEAIPVKRIATRSTKTVEVKSIAASPQPKWNVRMEPSERMRQRLEAVMRILLEVKNNCAGTAKHTDGILFYAIVAIIGETYNTLVNFQNDFKYGHLYEVHRTWAARCSIFSDPDWIYEDLQKMQMFPAILHAQLTARLSNSDAVAEIKAEPVFNKLFQAANTTDLQTRLMASLNHSMAVIQEFMGPTGDLSVRMNALAFAGACMRFDKAAMALIGVDYVAYRAHYHELHKKVSVLAKTLRHFNFKRYHPEQFLQYIHRTYAGMQQADSFLGLESPIFSQQNFPPLPKSSSLKNAAALAIVGISAEPRQAATSSSLPVAAALPRITPY